MTVRDLIEKLDAKVFSLPDGDREILDGYAGDFLSHVMSNAPTGAAWFTIMTNVNVAAVATLTDVAVAVICEDCTPDTMLVTRANENGINLIGTQLSVYEAIKKTL